MTPADPVGMDLLYQAKSLIEQPVQDLELKMKRELDLITKEQIALGVEVMTISKDFAD